MEKVVVLGGGNGAFITAADLASRGFSVNLFEMPDLFGGVQAAKEQGGIQLEVRGNLPLQSGFCPLNLVTSDPEEALKGVRVAFLVVPSFAQKRFAEAIAPYTTRDMLIVLSPGNFGGAIEFAQTLRGKGSPRVRLAEMECMIYSGFKNNSGSVWVSGYKKGLRVAAFPGRDTAAVLEELRCFYRDLRPARNVLETGLRNVNTVFHAPIVVLNAGRIEDTKGDFLFYWQGCTPAVGRVVEGVEEERLAIGAALGLDLTPNYQVMLEWYGHQGAKGPGLKEVMGTNPAYEWDTAPRSLEHRFLTEDIPYGMVPMESLGRLLGVPTPLTTGVIELAQRMLGKDLRQGARTLAGLGLGDMSLPELRELVDERGWWA
ncbi:MAG TPA: NAD/NADP octopine/nopaline dehydrogenase [Firmicutes bacterium]|nr:NAD/NADP octopine/nopaline dehydrogenase [Bacillota bacterium]